MSSRPAAAARAFSAWRSARWRWSAPEHPSNDVGRGNQARVCHARRGDAQAQLRQGHAETAGPRGPPCVREARRARHADHRALAATLHRWPVAGGPPMSEAIPLLDHQLAVLAQRANEHHAAVQRHRKAALTEAIAAGMVLIEAKPQVRYGQWSAWIKANCTFAERTAREYMD